MLSKPQNCLFELWESTSAPVFHMSDFWPAIDEAAVQAFLNGTMRQPLPVRPLNRADAATAKSKIDHFLNTISGFSADDYPCLETYRGFESERLLSLELVLETEAVRLTEANDQLYGPLASLHQPAATSYLAHHLEGVQPASAGVETARRQLLDLWKNAENYATIERHFALIEDCRLKLRSYAQPDFQKLGALLDDFPADTRLSSLDVAGVLDGSLDIILGARRSGWSAQVKPAVPNVHISYEARAVVIPAGRHYAKDHVAALAVHEIGVHILRSVNGQHSREKLARYGLPGYGPPEEAFGVLLGNSQAGSYEQINSLIPLAVMSFAARTDADFRSVFELTKALMICLANPNEAELQVKEPFYARNAFSRTGRVLRLGGTSLIERSTTKYWRGLLLISDYLQEQGVTPETFERFFAGKYDPSNSGQLELITTHQR